MTQEPEPEPLPEYVDEKDLAPDGSYGRLCCDSRTHSYHQRHCENNSPW